VQVKTMNQSIGKEKKQEGKQNNKFKKLVIENGLLWIMSEASKRVPKTYKAVSMLSAMGVPVGSEENTSHILYATPRLVKSQEMENARPEIALSNSSKKIKYIMKKKKIKVHLPIECRFVRQAKIWLSSSYERNSAYVAIQMYKG